MIEAGKSERRARATRREASLSDFEQIADLKERMGMRRDSIENWRRLWQDNPAVLAANRALPIGWVLESEGRVVGYLGSIPLLYLYGDRELFAAATCGFAVEPEYRAQALMLAAAFMKQPGVDLLLNTTASESAGMIFRSLGACPIPQENSDVALFWILDHHAFARFAMSRQGLKGSWSRLPEALIAIVSRVDTFFRRRAPRMRTDLGTYECAVSQVNEDFSELWRMQADSKPRLRACRTATMLRWHFEIPHSLRETQFICCRKDEHLVGYVCVSSEVINGTELRRSKVADLFVLNDDVAVIEALLAAAYQHARKAGSHVLEIIGFPQSIRRICAQGKPYRRRLPSWPFWYGVKGETLNAELASKAAWYLTPYDGDTTLWP